MMTEEKPATERPPKSKKKPGYLLPVIMLLVLIGGGIYMYLNLGNLAKGLVAAIASQTMGVPVVIATLEIDPAAKTIDVGDIVIGNPEGYETPYAIRVNKVHITAETISEQELVLSSVTAEGIEINLEVKESGTNLSDIHAQTNSKATSSLKDDGTPSKRVIIRDLQITNTKITPTLTLIDKPMEPVAVSKITMRNIGEEQGGATASEAIAAVLEEVVKVSMKQAGSAGFLQGMSADSLSDIKGSLGLSGGFFENLGAQSSDALGKAKQSFKGLFGD